MCLLDLARELVFGCQPVIDEQNRAAELIGEPSHEASMRWQTARYKPASMQVDDPWGIGIGMGADPHCWDAAGIDWSLLDLCRYI
jgi:hypothetical protein